MATVKTYKVVILVPRSSLVPPLLLPLTVYVTYTCMQSKIEYVCFAFSL